MTAAAASGLLYGGNVRANGIRQHYLRFGGRGSVLVIVPGITTAAAQWAFVAERLCSTFDIYILDVRGRGLSESGAHLDYSLDACAADVVAFAAVLGLKKYTLLGHSMGARIGIRAARQQPETMKQLVLVDPPMSGPGRRAYPIPLEPLMALLHAAKRGEADTALRSPNAPRWPEAHIRVRAEWLHTCDERAIAESYRGFHEDDIHADLPHLSVPTALMVAGKGGVILRRSYFGRAIAAIKQDDVVAQAMGVNVFAHRLSLFIASGFISGAAGAFAAHLNFFVGPTDFGLTRSVDALTYPILGGVNALAGPAIGAVFSTVLPEALRFSNQLREILMGALVVAIVLFLPGGAMSVLKWRWNLSRFGLSRSNSPRTEP